MREIDIMCAKCTTPMLCASMATIDNHNLKVVDMDMKIVTNFHFNVMDNFSCPLE